MCKLKPKSPPTPIANRTTLMKHSIPILATCLFASLSTLTAGEVVLAADQSSAYRIVLPDEGPNEAIAPPPSRSDP